LTDRVAVSFVIELDDIVDSSRMMSTRSPDRWLTPLVGTVLLVAAGAVALGGDVLVAALLGIFGLLALGGGRLRAIDRWLLSRQSAPVLGVPCKITADESGVGLEQAGVTALHSYEVLQRLDEADRAMVIMGRNNARIGIPKRAFPSRADENAFGAVVLKRPRRPKPTVRNPPRLVTLTTGK